MEQGPILLRHYAAQDRVEFGDELARYTTVLEPEDFDKKLNQYDSSRSKLSHPFDLGPTPMKEKAACEFLNNLIGKFRSESSNIPIAFIVTGSKAPKGHSSVTQCRPDIVAVQITKLPKDANANKDPGQTKGHAQEDQTEPKPTDARPTMDIDTTPRLPSHIDTTPDIDTTPRLPSHIDTTPDIDIPLSSDAPAPTDALGTAAPVKVPSVSWVELETVIAYHSMGKTVPENIDQVVPYTGYLLTDRPDRVAVLGLYIGPTGFAPVLMDHTHAYRTNLITWKASLAKALLHRVLTYIENPPRSMMDPTTTRNDDGTFDIRVDGQVHRGCKQLWSSPLGRWTTIFKTRSGVLKGQYRRCNSNADSEGKILIDIHDSNQIPGVVRVARHQLVVCGPEDHARQKVCIELMDEGDPFMAINKPFDALRVIWDLLEVTRCLYKQRRVLHRDLSKGNVLFKKSVLANAVPVVASIQEMPNMGFCSVLHILNRRHPPDITPTLLIDFDHAVMKGGTNDTTRQTVGTPVFMARAAVIHGPVFNRERFSLLGLPRLSDDARKVYEEVLPTRLEQFPQPVQDQEKIHCTCETPPESLTWSHELRHEAESAFWLLVWWAVHIRPSDGKKRHDPSVSTVPTDVWMDLTRVDIAQKADRREDFLNHLLRRNLTWLDPAYKGLNPLFQRMGRQIEEDLHWVETAENPVPSEMKEPDFLHEALQRIIFDFLIRNEHEPFMQLQAHTIFRVTKDWLQKHADTSMTPNSSGTKRSHDETEEESGPAIDRVTKRTCVKRSRKEAIPLDTSNPL